MTVSGHTTVKVYDPLQNRNLPSDIYDHYRPRSACTAKQPYQGLPCLLLQCMLLTSLDSDQTGQADLNLH